MNESQVNPIAVRTRIPPLTWIAGALWIGAVCYLMSSMWTYDNTPGRKATAGAQWPARMPASAHGLQLIGGRDTVVMFVHPRCSCSRASLGNLSTIMAQTDGKLAGYVVAYEPTANAGSQWTGSDLVATASGIRGIHVVMDPGGAIASRFGVATSGQTIVYSPAGLTLFSGGITAARGEYGDNNGMSAVISWVNRGRADEATAPVFGCSIRDFSSDSSTRAGMAPAAGTQ